MHTLKLVHRVECVVCVWKGGDTRPGAFGAVKPKATTKGGAGLARLPTHNRNRFVEGNRGPSKQLRTTSVPLVMNGGRRVQGVGWLRHMRRVGVGKRVGL